MNRRGCLVKCASLTTSLLIAGCSGANTDSAGEPTATESNGTPVSKQLEVAADAMESAGEEIDKESNKFTSSDFENGGVDIRTATIYDYLDTAETRLEAAEPNATDE